MAAMVTALPCVCMPDNTPIVWCVLDVSVSGIIANGGSELGTPPVWLAAAHHTHGGKDGMT